MKNFISLGLIVDLINLLFTCDCDAIYCASEEHCEDQEEGDVEQAPDMEMVYKLEMQPMNEKYKKSSLNLFPNELRSNIQCTYRNFHWVWNMIRNSDFFLL